MMRARARFPVECPDDEEMPDVVTNGRMEPWWHKADLLFPPDSSLPLLAALSELLEGLDRRRN